MIPTLGILYLSVVGVLVSGIIYITFAEVFKNGIKINISRGKKGEIDGRKKKKKKATTSKTKA